MAIEAPISKFKRNNLKIYAIALLIIAVWFAYDGYLNEGFRKKHTSQAGQADDTLKFNQISPYFLLTGAALIAVYFFSIKNKKLVADEDSLVIDAKKKIQYSSIEKINKTLFKSKGRFVITYKPDQKTEHHLKLSDKRYDNLEAILNHLIEKIT